MTTPTMNAALIRSGRWKLVALILLILFSIVALLTVENLLVSCLVAFVISYTLGPLVSALERYGVSRNLAATLTFLAVGAILIGLALWLVPYLAETLESLQADIPRLIGGLSDVLKDLESRVHAVTGPLSKVDVTGQVETFLTSWTQDFFNGLPSYVKTFITVMLLGPFIAFFMVRDGRVALRTVLALAPNHLFETVLNLQHQINVQIGQFVRARILESLIVGTVTAGGLLIIQFPYAMILGILAGLTNFIPYLGPIFGAVPAFVIAFVNHHSGLDVFLVAVVYIIAQLIDAGFLIPLVVAKIVDLHPVTVILVIIAGAQVMGVLGMIISIPVAATLKVTVGTIYRHLTDTRT